MCVPETLKHLRELASKTPKKEQTKYAFVRIDALVLRPYADIYDCL